MDLTGYAPHIQQLLGMIQTQPLFPGLSPLHPAFYQAAASVQPSQNHVGTTVISPMNMSQEAAQIFHQRLLATVCNASPQSGSGQVSPGVLGSMFGLPSREMGLSGNFTIDAILGNKENQQVVATKGAGVARQMDKSSMEDAIELSAPVSRYSTRINSTGSDEGGQSNSVYHQERQYTVMDKDSFEDRRRRFFTEKHYQQRCHQHTAKPYDGGSFSINNFQDQRGVGKNKRVRTIFTPEQLERLEAVFQKQQYMVGTERYYLAASLNLSEAQVKVWFQNRRIKWRKHQFEEQHQLLQSQQGISLEDDDENEALRFPRSCESTSYFRQQTGHNETESKLASESLAESGFVEARFGNMTDSEVDVQEEFTSTMCLNEAECHKKDSVESNTYNNRQDQLNEDLKHSTGKQCKPFDTMNRMDETNRNAPAELQFVDESDPFESNYRSGNNLRKQEYFGDNNGVLDFTMGSKQSW